MGWIKVTGPEGDPVYIKVDQIVRISPSTQSDAAHAKSLVDLANGHTQAVTEQAADVLRLAQAAENEDANA